MTYVTSAKLTSTTDHPDSDSSALSTSVTFVIAASALAFVSSQDFGKCEKPS